MNIDNLSGQTLGQYELRELLGVGGMGVVYKAYQTNLRREVAIKILSINLITSDLVARFNREAQTAASLEHPNIVPIHDFGSTDGATYIVMRLLTGGSLADRLERSVAAGLPLPSLPEIARLVYQLAGAMDYAHRRGIVHRDIKTSNIMFDADGNAFLVDFGIAKILGDSQTNLTNSGFSMGTPIYMAPEQWRQEELTPATDQYALGIIVYILVTGQIPFDAPTPFLLMQKHLSETPLSISALRQEVPNTLSEVIERSLAKDPSDRFPSVMAFAEAFVDAISGVESVPRENIVPAQPGARMVTPPPIFRTGETGEVEISAPGASRGKTTIPVVEPRFLPVSPPAGKSRSFSWLIALAAMIVIGIVAVLLIAPRDQQQGDEADLTQVAALITETPRADETEDVFGSAAGGDVEQSSAEETPANGEPVNDASGNASGGAAAAAQLVVEASATPTSTPTDTPSPTATNTPSSTPTNTPTNTPTSTPTDTPSPTATNTPSSTPTNTPTSTPTDTPSPTATNTPSSTPSNTPTVTLTSTATLTATSTATLTLEPSSTPNVTNTPNLLATRIAQATQAAAMAQAGGQPVITCTIQTDRVSEVLVRVGPGTNRSLVKYLPANQVFRVLGQAAAEDGELWWKLDKAEIAPQAAASQVWVLQADVISNNEADCNRVPTVEPPPIISFPTATPTAMPTAVPQAQPQNNNNNNSNNNSSGGGSGSKPPTAVPTTDPGTSPTLPPYDVVPCYFCDNIGDAYYFDPPVYFAPTMAP